MGEEEEEEEFPRTTSDALKGFKQGFKYTMMISCAVKPTRNFFILPLRCLVLTRFNSYEVHYSFERAVTYMENVRSFTRITIVN